MLKQPNTPKKETALEKEAEKELLACLAEIPFLSIVQTQRQPRDGNWRPDLMIDIRDGNREESLVVECKTSGQPRIAREAVNQLLLYLGDFKQKVYGIFAAPYISPRAAEICAQNGIGYIDLAGNCLISFEKIFIKKEGKPNPFVQKRDLRSLYSPRSERVLRVILNEPKRVWKIQELAKAAGVSLGQTFNVKKLLLNREWLQTAQTREGFALSQPLELLREWSENYDFRRNTVFEYYSMKSPSEIEAELSRLFKEKGIACGLTGFSGSARLGIATRYQRAMAYVGEGDLEAVEQRLGLKRVTSGANVILLLPYDDGVFLGATSKNQDEVVSSVQVYLDLVGYRGRGEEAAGQLLNEVIKPQWE
ncbi:MAG: hypothetical protein HYW49_04265 [Deltaproteobacteria bacterium]|nr:hypothetical protein [Deltaproteobacteria bacterium]